jgi:hypothetical protein
MTDVLEALRELLQAAAPFEKRTAHHRGVEQDRQALREALTRTQLVLSVADCEPSSRPALTIAADKPLREKAPASRRRHSTRQSRK